MRREYVHFLANDAVYIWRVTRRESAQLAHFAADAAGQDGLRQWLAQAADWPHRLILEAERERFQIESLPASLSARARRALIERRLQRNAPNATAHAWLELRGSDGAPAALLASTGSEPGLAAWLACYTESGVALYACHLAGLLAATNLNMNEAAQHVLPAANGWRLLHVAAGQVQESRRLAELPDAATLQQSCRPGERLIVADTLAHTDTFAPLALHTTHASRAGRVRQPGLERGWRLRQGRRLAQALALAGCTALLAQASFDALAAHHARLQTQTQAEEAAHLHQRSQQALAQRWQLPREEWQLLQAHLQHSSPLGDWTTLAAALPAGLPLQAVHWQAGPAPRLSLVLREASPALLAELAAQLAAGGCEAGTQSATAPSADAVQLSVQCGGSRS